MLFVLARFAGLISVLSASSLEPINFHEFHSTLSLSGARKKEKKMAESKKIVQLAQQLEKCEVVETPEPFDMDAKEREIINEVTTTECGSECKHCVHTEECDPKAHFRKRYCAICRVQIFRRMQEWIAIQFERKKARSERDGTQEFMSTSRMFYTNPASYEYVHINSNRRFSSGFPKLDDAVKEYLADPDRDLSLEESLHKSLCIKSSQQAKVFTQVYMGGAIKPREMEELVEKFGRIDTYSSEEFVAISDKPPYEYVHLNEHVKFKSEHGSINEAITEYLATYKKRHGVLRDPFEFDNYRGQIFCTCSK